MPRKVKQSQKRNATSFKPGPDPRRHVFSRAERQKGYLVATRFSKMPSRTRAWLWKKIRGHYRRKGQWQPAKLTGRKS